MYLTHLKNFGFLEVTGRDAVKFLQGYATCDLDALEQSQFAMGAICNIQGRMVTSFRILRTDTGLLLRMDKGLVQPTIDFLAKYIVFSKAEMTDMSETYTCYGCIGELEEAHKSRQNLTIAVSSTRHEIWSTRTLNDASSDATEWENAEIEDGLVWVNGDSADAFIPQMFNYHEKDAIDFEKGCYLGQEIVARMQYRGELKRRLHIASVSADIGSDVLEDNGKLLGTVVRSSGSQVLAVLKNTAPTVRASTAGQTADFVLLEPFTEV